MHGAFISGLREAANITLHANARAAKSKVDKKSIDKHTGLCCYINGLV
jgi:lysine-specific histone demethylase 1